MTHKKRTTGWPFYADPAKHRALVGDNTVVVPEAQQQPARPHTPRGSGVLRFETHVGEALTYDFTAPRGDINRSVVGNTGNGMSIPDVTGTLRGTRSWK